MADVVINGSIDIRWPAIADKRFGPYNSVAAAKAAVPISRRAIGLMVMVAGEIYWWKTGTADEDLIAYTVPSSVKEYAALISQSGTSAPSVSVIYNSLSAPLVWTRTAMGTYVGTLTGAFPSGKTFIPNPVSTPISYAAATQAVLARTSANTVTLMTQTDASAVDGVLNSFPVFIKVYP